MLKVQNEYLKVLAGGLPYSKLIGERSQSSDSQTTLSEGPNKSKVEAKNLQSSSTSRNDYEIKQRMKSLQLVHEVEPLLRDPFSFYGASLQLAEQDRINIVQNELVLYYKGQIEQMKLKVQEALLN